MIKIVEKLQERLDMVQDGSDYMQSKAKDLQIVKIELETVRDKRGGAMKSHRGMKIIDNYEHPGFINN